MAIKALSHFNKKRFLTIVWAVVALGWALMGAAIVLSAPKPYLIAVVTFVAVSTEGAIWLTSLILGVAMIDARKAIIAKIQRAFAPEKTH